MTEVREQEPIQQEKPTRKSRVDWPKRFWDIEAWKRLFLWGVKLGDNSYEIHYLAADEEVRAGVLKACNLKRMQGGGNKVAAYDLSKDASRLKYHMRKARPQINTGAVLMKYLNIKPEDVEPKEAWYMSFNGLGYDLPMMDYIMQSIMNNRVQTTPQTIREFSDSLLAEMRQNGRRYNTKEHELYGNQIDIAKLEEKLWVTTLLQ